MKLIIAGVTHVHRIISSCARRWHRSATASPRSCTAAPGAPISSAFAGPCGITCARAASQRTGSASGKVAGVAAITRWRRQETCSSRSGMNSPRHRAHDRVHACSWANRSWSSAWRPPHKKSAWHVSRRFSRVSEPREGSWLYLNPLTQEGSSACPRQYHIRFPTAQAHAIADLTGYEDAATLRWQQACVQAANTLTAFPNGRYVNVRMERMRQGLELAQRGAVTLPEDGEELSAVVRSGNNLYQVDTRLLTCTCADYQKHLQACKHLLAVEVHLGALGLLPPAAPEPAAAGGARARAGIRRPWLRHRAPQAGPSAKRPPRSTSSSRSATWNSCSPCGTWMT